MQLIDEQDHVAGATDLVHHRLDAFFKLPSVLRARNHHGQVQHDDASIGQELRDVVGNDELGQPLDDGRLADSGLTQQYGVVFLAPTENLNDALDFPYSPDHRIQLSLSSDLGKVPPKGVQRRRLALALFRFSGNGGPDLIAFVARAEQIEHLFADVFQAQVQIHQHLRGYAVLLAKQPQQQVLGTDVVMVQVAGFLDGVLDDFLGPRCLRQLAHRDRFRPALDQLFDLEPHLAQVDVEVLEHVRPHSGALLDQPQQDVLRPDVFVVETLGFLIGQRHHLPRAVCKSLKHFVLSSP